MNTKKSELLKFYLVFAIRGMNPNEKEKQTQALRVIFETLLRYGAVLNAEVVRDFLNNGRDTPADDIIYKRDIAWLIKADAMVILYGHSFGGGYESGFWDALRKMMVINSDSAIAFFSPNTNPSALCNGNPNITKTSFYSPEEVGQKLEEYLQKTLRLSLRS
jgi:hypothetical protein